MARVTKPRMSKSRGRGVHLACGYATCRCNTLTASAGTSAQPRECPVAGCGATIRGNVCPDPRGVH